MSINKTIKKPELLAPAGDLEKLKVAFHFGADAVYTGLKQFSLRANSRNFDNESIIEGIEYTRKLGKKLYIALNIYFTPDQTADFIKQLKFINKIKPDGIIISDPGAIYLAKEHAPDVPIHISTQANTTNQYAAKLYAQLGAERVVTARELSLQDIATVKRESGLEIEAFIHGAMCISYSGRCLLSSYMTDNNLGMRPGEESKKVRSANKGDCAHSCRWEFILKEKSRAEQNYEIEEDESGTYILSSKDICMIDYVKELIEAGIDSFKVEGRMKSVLYISSIIRAYRRAIDAYYDNSISYNRDEIEKELNIVSHREFCTGFYFDSPIDQANLTGNIMYKRDVRLAALVKGPATGKRLCLKLYNSIKESDRLELIGPNMRTIEVAGLKLFDKDGNRVEKAGHMKDAFIELYDNEGEIIEAMPLDILRMEHEF